MVVVMMMMKWMDGWLYGTKNEKLQPYLLGRKTGMKQYLKFFNGILTVSSYSAALTTKSSPCSLHN
jgi:hypothetical protein